MQLERRVEVETPEHVALAFQLAGPGSRFIAFLYDVTVIVASGITLLALLALFNLLGVPDIAMPILSALLLLAVFLLFWGYFTFFEGFREGQTPGKKRFGLRVVHEGGYPLTLRGAAVRNLVRIVDWQPMPSWGLGGLLVLLHPRSQRLGDMAAGTIVVRERAAAALPEEVQAAGPPRLSDEEYDVLRQYATRRDALESAARLRVAGKLAPHFAPYARETARARLIDTANPHHADDVLMAVYADESGRRIASGARTGSGSPAAAALLRRQRPRWAEYLSLLRRARSQRLSRLPEAEVSRFAALYREVAADLARARTYGASADMLYTLERAVGSGHNLLYRTPPASARRAWHWLTISFPRLVRARSGAILLASLLLYAPAVAAYMAVVLEPDRARVIIPAGMIARAEEGAERQQRGEGYIDVPEMMMPVFSTRIITNNVQVAFLAFAGGVLAGAGTILILLTNGIFLGAVAGLFHAESLKIYFWSFVLPHGVIELTAICIAGGAGLWLGSAFVLPGRRTRREVLVERGREAVSMIGGVAMLLVFAGIIEGFISPSTLPAPAKFIFSALTLLILGVYLTRTGRDEVTTDLAA
jgi:uncharacterized membrane protein SpoIIM required for sporulation/uncharacterized RDD family membrane protein YckC